MSFYHGITGGLLFFWLQVAIISACVCNCICFTMHFHLGDSNAYTQNAIISLKMEKTSLIYPQLPPDLAHSLTLSRSNYRCLEQNNSMITKMFESSKFDPISYKSWKYVSNDGQSVLSFVIMLSFIVTLNKDTTPISYCQPNQIAWSKFT